MHGLFVQLDFGWFRKRPRRQVHTIQIHLARRDLFATNQQGRVLEHVQTGHAVFFLIILTDTTFQFPHSRTFRIGHAHHAIRKGHVGIVTGRPQGQNTTLGQPNAR